MTATAIRQSADQRRGTVLRVAVEEFAKTGLAGTSTQTIADRAGISQPYLFRLYASKKALFLAAAEHCHQRIIDEFEQAAGDSTGLAAFERMGERYGELIGDRTFLLLQLQIYAASEDGEVQAAARDGFRRIWQTIARISGLPAQERRQFYALGMLCNVVTALGLDEMDEVWACEACPETKAETIPEIAAKVAAKAAAKIGPR
ncbi:MAG: TetR/AcrR family transcriptional regulator [Pseudonocardiales bacterium]|nr:MAG: TetR/AcrR family transcriptional regulator [Pseudonocardiales bacterium]PZS29166.1 MAG: TetR/AcrR family transcriptional regulator [Pseudonocardiales bacterium]